MVSVSRSVVPDSLQPHGLQPSVHEIFQARIPEWVSHFLLQGIFPTQELNPGLLHCRQILYQLSYKESPRVHSSAGASQVALVVKNLSASAGDTRDAGPFLCGKIPWRRAWQPAPVGSLAWTEEPGGLRFIRSQRDDT